MKKAYEGFKYLNVFLCDNRFGMVLMITNLYIHLVVQNIFVPLNIHLMTRSKF